MLNVKLSEHSQCSPQKMFKTLIFASNNVAKIKPALLLHILHIWELDVTSILALDANWRTPFCSKCLFQAFYGNKWAIVKFGYKLKCLKPLRFYIVGENTNTDSCSEWSLSSMTSLFRSRHRSLPDLQNNSPKSTRSAPWERSEDV